MVYLGAFESEFERRTRSYQKFSYKKTFWLQGILPLIVNFLLETDLCLPYLSFIQKTAAEGYDSGILFMIFRIDNNGGVICFFFLSYLSNIAVRYIPFGRPNNRIYISNAKRAFRSPITQMLGGNHAYDRRQDDSKRKPNRETGSKAQGGGFLLRQVT